MKNTLIIISMVAIFCTLSSANKKEIYKDPKTPINERVEDLLNRMTLEEKVGQMNQFVGLEHIRANSHLALQDLKNNTAQAFYPGVTDKDVAHWTEQGLIGSFLHVLTVEEANLLQGLAMKSRLQIPILFGIDAIHGNANCPDNTVYPTNIGMACSFDTLMAYTIARQTAVEMRSMNLHWTFNPNVEVARDPRWGRCGETYGEDPYLVTQMGVQSVKGYQRQLNSETDVLACIKHFIGGSEPINGTNGAPADISERTLREVFFPPFKACVKAGAMSLMTSHNELNGVPCHSNEWLMTDILRKEWKFPGFIVSDWMDIEHLHDLHGTAENNKEAFYQSIMAGMDMHMHGLEWQQDVVELVKEGRISESRIDESVRHILTIKFRLGLFEHPYANVKKSKEIRLSKEHRTTSLEASRNSIVLLKNDHLLPLDETKYKHVLVTGINANDQNIMGDWSALQKDENVITILKGLRLICPNTDFNFVDQGWDPRNMDSNKVNEAAEKAKQSDLNIVVAGEYMMRFRWTDRTGGEDTDRSDIDLVGLQNELIKKVAASGKPTILILINGRPLGIQWPAEHLPAIIEAWEPGMYGGQAVAEILYGKVNPSAKLAITIPRSVGQTQMIYNHKASAYFHPVVVTPSTPLYPFGYGLSYTTYKYGPISLDKQEIGPNDSLKATINVTNTGKRDGTEIVQLYIRDVYSSVTRPVKELKDFARIFLAAGETKQVTFNITPDKLGFYNQQMQWQVEPGDFIGMIGGSSNDEDLQKITFRVNKQNRTIQTEALLRNLTKIASKGYFFGHQDDTNYGVNWINEEGRSDVKDVCGDYPGLIGFDLGHIELNAEKNLDGVPFDKIRKEAINQYLRGGIVTLSWHLNNPLTNKDAWDVSDTTVVSSILPGGKNYELFQSWLIKVADFLNTLVTNDGTKIPVIFRPWHENTGSWFWWGSKLCTPQEYKALWALTETTLRTHGVNNVLYAYSPGSDANEQQYMGRYPGDELVDILGLDIYMSNSDQAFVKDMQTSLDFISRNGQIRHKIIAVTETGFQCIPESNWWTNVLMPAIDKYPISYILVWRNAHDRENHYYAPYSGQGSAGDFVKFYQNPKTFFSKDIQNLYK